jgi:hypothetical protein
LIHRRYAETELHDADQEADGKCSERDREEPMDDWPLDPL